MVRRVDAVCEHTFPVRAIQRMAEIIVTFKPGRSESYIGRDALLAGVSKGYTMNLGTLDDTSPPDAIQRTILHEFGHALGMRHEHQNPPAEIPWNKEVHLGLIRSRCRAVIWPSQPRSTHPTQRGMLASALGL